MTMRAAVLHEYGVPNPDEFEDPEAGADQAVVEVLAAGVIRRRVDLRGALLCRSTAAAVGRRTRGRRNRRRARGDFDVPVAPFGSMAERALVDPRYVTRP